MVVKDTSNGLDKLVDDILLARSKEPGKRLVL